MTEEEWLTCAEPRGMLEFLSGKGSDRKSRYFAFACCRAVWLHLTEDVHHEAVLVAEQHADGLVSDAELGKAIANVHRHRRKRNNLDLTVYYAVRYPRGGPYTDADSVADGIARILASVAAPDPSPTARTYFFGETMVHERPAPNADRLTWNATYAHQKRVFADMLRDIFGNPFRPVAFDPAWRTTDVMLLAQGIYTERAFDRMPILADALQDAGCTNEDILNHCRDANATHVRGCWVVDLVLGKE